MDWLKMRKTLLKFLFLSCYALLMSPLVLFGIVARIAFQGFVIGWSTMDMLGQQITMWLGDGSSKEPSRIDLLSPNTVKKIDLQKRWPKR